MNSKMAITAKLTSFMIILLLALFLLPGAFAQSSDSSAKLQSMLSDRAKEMGKELGLTSDQVAQLEKINADALTKMKAISAQTSGDKKAAAKQMKGVLDERGAALDKLMTPDQRKKYTATQEEDLSMMQTEMMSVSLKLTDEQVTKIDKINLTALQKMNAAKSEPRKIKKMRDVRSAMQAKEADLQKTLTPDQWKQYQATKEQMPKHPEEAAASTSG